MLLLQVNTNSRDVDLLNNDDIVIRLDADINNHEIYYYYDKERGTIFINNIERKMMLIKSGGHSLYGKSPIIYLKKRDFKEFKYITRTLSTHINSQQVTLAEFIESCL